jgi:hypothetical protein
MSGKNTITASSVNTPLGNVSLTGSSTYSWLGGSTRNAYVPNAYASMECGAEAMKIAINTEGSKKGTCYVLTPSPLSHTLAVQSVVWEVFVTPPENDLEALAREPDDFASRPLWETPSGLFLAGVFGIEAVSNRWLNVPLATLVGGTLRPEAQHVIGTYRFSRPFVVPPGSQVKYRIDVRDNWRPSGPLTLRCTVNYDLPHALALR